MAIIQLNGIISNIKGSVGGITFSNTRAGIAVKRKLSGKKAITSKQANALNVGRLSANSWRSMTFGQKENWNAFASTYTFTNRYGTTTALTGFNWFTSINNNRYLFNLSAILVPPTYDVPSPLPLFYLTLSSSDMVVSWSEPIDDSTTDIVVFASVPSRSQAQFNRGKYRMLSIGLIDYTSSFSIKEAWEQATGLNYEECYEAGNFNINALIVPYSKSSYISGGATTSTGAIPVEGIGAMEIGSTFEVS